MTSPGTKLLLASIKNREYVIANPTKFKLTSQSLEICKQGLVTIKEYYDTRTNKATHS